MEDNYTGPRDSGLKLGNIPAHHTMKYWAGRDAEITVFEKGIGYVKHQGHVVIDFSCGDFWLIEDDGSKFFIYPFDIENLRIRKEKARRKQQAKHDKMMETIHDPN